MSDGEDAGDTRLASSSTDGLYGLLEALSGTYNFDFCEYKEPSLARRIRTRMSQVHVDSFEAYARYLEQHAEEHIALFNTILINVTGFFRDPEAWRVMASDIIPRIVSAAAESRSLRIWSAGCSSGEEPYSMAMLLAEYLGDQAPEYLIKIYGTDVDEDALAAARHAVYRLEQLKDVPDMLVDRYFSRDGHLFRLRHDLRRWCIFGAHNLVQAPPLSDVDLLICRNVLIYFTSELQERILSRFHNAIRENGCMFLGRSESLLARSRLFRPLQLKWRIFERMPTMARQVTAVLPDRDEAHGVSFGEAHFRAEGPPALHLQRTLEALPAAVMIIDMTDRILFWNAAAEAMFEVPIASAVAREFRDLDVSYRVEGLRARIEDVKGRHAPAKIEGAAFARRNGETVRAEISIIPLFEAHRLTAILVFALEGTEQARLKEQMSRISEQHATAIEELQSTNEELETTVQELQAANTELGTLNSELEGRTAELNRLDAFHRSLVNSLEQAIVVVDREAIVTAWNQTAERVWGLAVDHALTRQFFALPIGAVAQRTREPFDRVISTGEAMDVPKVPYNLPGGTARDGTLRLHPLRSRSGEVLGAVIVMALATG